MTIQAVSTNAKAVVRWGMMRLLLISTTVLTSGAVLFPNQRAVAAAPSSPVFQSTPPGLLYPNSYPAPASGPYTVTVDCTDPDGRSDLDNCYLRLSQADNEDNSRQTIQWFPGNTCVQWDDEPHRLTNFSCSSTTITNGYRITFTFKIDGSWVPSTNVDYYAWTYDGSASSSHVKNNRNASYDNALRIASTWSSNGVDSDIDTYYSSIRINVNIDTALSSRTVNAQLWYRPSGV